MARASKHVIASNEPLKAVTIPEASRITRLGRTHIFEAIRSGKLPSLKIGKSRRILLKDIDKYLEGFRVKMK
jgi:excisionase family DNA binding protein